MKFLHFFVFLGALSIPHQVTPALADLVANALGSNNLDDALFLYKALKVNNNPEQIIAYWTLLDTKFGGNDAALQQALAKIPMAGSMTADKYKGHQGPQAIDDMIEMFQSGPGGAVYQKLAPAKSKEAIDKVITALEETKTLLS